MAKSKKTNKVETPKAPEMEAPKVPEVETPKAPEKEAPKVPEVETPEAPKKEKKVSPRISRAREVFETHAVDEVYFTTDDTCFVNRSYATMHAANLKDARIDVVTKKEV